MHKRFASALIAAAALVAAPRVAHAHQVGLSRGDYAVDKGVVQVDVVLARGDAATLELSQNTPLEEVVAVSAAGTACTPKLLSLEPTTADGLALHASYACNDASAPATVEVKLVDTLSGGHRHLAHLGGRDVVLKEGHTRFELTPARAASASPALGALVAMGVEHILQGWDHLLFLFGLLLLRSSLRALATTISAFTLAHSLTLGLAAFGVWTPPAAIVEPAIALSIAYVGVENIRALASRRAIQTAEKRWRVTFPFGLVHGFGFASALQALGMARSDVPKALFGFNLGVEMGQLAVVIPLALGAAWLSRRNAVPAKLAPVLSAAIIVIGVALFAVRVA
jgi:HupE/UreJ protein